MPSGVYERRPGVFPRIPWKTRFQRQFARIKNKNSCWEWPGARDVNGYGTITINGKADKAHRASWRYFKGSIPEGIEVCHACDNPPCIRADTGHLFLGTHKDNMADAAAKGRMKGVPDNYHAAVLTEDKVREIHRLFAAGNTNIAELAVQFKISRPEVHGIVRGRRWRSLGLSDLSHIRKQRKISRNSFIQIRERYRAGERPADLAKIYGVTATRIIQIGKHEI